MSVSAAQLAIAGEQSRGKPFGERHVRGVAGCDRGSQLPNTIQQRNVFVPHHRHVDEILQHLIRPLSVDFARERQPAQNLRHLDVNEMRRVKRVVCLKHPSGVPKTERRLQQDFEDNRSIEHPHVRTQR